MHVMRTWPHLVLAVFLVACGDTVVATDDVLDAPPSLEAPGGEASAGEAPGLEVPAVGKPGTEATPEAPPEETGPAQPEAEGFAWSHSWITADAQRPVASAMWVGKAAWADLAGVSNELRARVGAGEAPYVFFYHWGDGGAGRPLSDFHGASDSEIAEWEQWGAELARAIGEAPAWIVLEPEYDANLPAACSERFEGALKRIIASFRRLAPNARLINGPGLWKPEGDYACFADVASRMDLQGFLLHISSRSADCTWRTDGSRYEGGEELGTAVEVTQKIRARAGKMRRLFGGSTFFVSDLAVTSCGWGEEGQRQIFKALVDALPELYREGVRGISIRNGGPAEHERYLGVNNEGGFGYSGKPAQAEYDRAPAVLQQYLGSLRAIP